MSRWIPILALAVILTGGTCLTSAIALSGTQEVRASGGPQELDRSRPSADEGPTRVTVGVFMLDLIDISGADQSFRADVVVMVRWNDPRLAGRWEETQTLAVDEVWHPEIEVVNRRTLERTLADVVEVNPDGDVVYQERLMGEYAVSMDLREFPRDRQVFSVHFVSARNTTEEVEMFPDPDSSRIGMADRVSITDWRVESPRLENRDYVAVTGVRATPGVAFVFEAERRLSYYAVQVVLPLIMIVMMAGTVFWIDPSVIPTRMSVVVTTMLTLIAYRFALGAHVPPLPYLTKLDYFLLGSTVMVLTTLILMAGSSYLVSRERKPLAERINSWGRVAFPVLLGLLVLFFAWR